MVAAELPHKLTSFFFNDTATTEIYTLSYTTLFRSRAAARAEPQFHRMPGIWGIADSRATPSAAALRAPRSEEHTSELQSRQYLVCRLLLEKKQKATP